MDDTTQSISNFTDLLARATPRQQTALIDTAQHAPENLEHIVFTVLSEQGLDTRYVNDIIASGQKYVTPENSNQFEREGPKERGKDHSPFLASGNLINYDKYEGQILENLDKERQDDAIAKLKAATTEKEQIEAFQQILSDASPEKVIHEQEEKLVEQLQKAEEGQTLKSNEVGSEKLRLRINELRNSRSADQGKYSSLQANEHVQRHILLTSLQDDVRTEKNKVKRKEIRDQIDVLNNDFRKLSQEEKETARQNIKQYDDLAHRFRYQREGALNVHQLTEEFSKLKPEQREAFLRSILRNQHITLRGEIGSAFSLKDHRVFSPGYKKTLSRSQKRSLLNAQSKKSSSPQRFPTNSLWNRVLKNFSEYNTPGMIQEHQYSQRQTSSSNNFNPFDTVSDIANMARKGRNIFNLARTFFSGGGAGAGGTGFLAATSEFWVPALIILVVIILLVLFIVLIIFLFVSNQNTSPLDQTVTPVVCGDTLEAVTSNNYPAIAAEINKKYSINIAAQIDSNTDQRIVNIEKDMFNSFCLLFGHIKDDISIPVPQEFNTFGNLTVGTKAQRASPHVMKITFTLLLDVPGKPCSIEENTRNSNKAVVNWIINNGDTCLSSPGSLEFLVAQALSKSLVRQQNYLHNTDPQVFTDFSNGVFPQSKLPTQFCSTTPTNTSCFADMVAAYLTWGYPIINASSSASLNTSIKPTNINDLLGNIGKYSDTYPTYYIYAKEQLFNGHEFFIDNNFFKQREREFVDDVQACQGANGIEYTPDKRCINQIELSVKESGDIKFANALGNVGYDYQCGHFIWSIQTLFGWEHFAFGDGAGVSAWYFYGKYSERGQRGYTHTQEGYKWFDNPFINGFVSGTKADIQPGDIIMYATDVPSNDFGHIAVISEVESDTFHVKVDEANFHEDAHGKGILTKDRALTLNQSLRDDGKVGKVIIRGWWRKIDTTSSQATQ